MTKICNLEALKSEKESEITDIVFSMRKELKEIDLKIEALRSFRRLPYRLQKTEVN